MGGVQPPSSHVRVFAQANVTGLRALRWGDVRKDDPNLEGWLAAGLVTLTDADGNGPPDELPRGCCGDS